MKQFTKVILSLVLAAALLVPLLPLRAEASTGNISLSVFTDSNFRAAVKDAADKNGDGSLSSAEIANCKYLWASDKGITSLQGVQYLTGLIGLYVGNNNISSVNLAANTKLEALFIYSNNLSSLDISRNTQLKDLYCGNNDLTSLDLTHQPYLEDVSFYSNSISSINLSKNTRLEHLDCSANDLTSLNVSACTALKGISCDSNSLTSLNLGTLKNIETLVCFDNKLTSLNVSNLVNLQTLFFDNNGLTSISLANNKNLKSLSCYRNKLSRLDTSALTQLDRLSCGHNQLTALSLTNNSKLTHLDCCYNSITKLNVSNLKNLDMLDCSHNALTSLDVSKCTDLTHIYCGYNGISSLNVSNCKKVTWLSCPENKLASLDVHKLPDTLYVSAGWQSVPPLRVTVSIGQYRKNIYAGYDTEQIIAKPDRVTLSSATAGTNKVVLKWAKSASTDAYQVYRSVNGGSYTKIKSTKSLTYTDTDVSKGHTYAYKVRGYYTEDSSQTYGSFSAAKAVTFKPDQVTLSSAAACTSGVVLKWAKAAGAAKYQVFRSTNGGDYTCIKTTTALTYTDTNVKAGRKYSYKVRGCFTSGDTNVAGACSAIKTVTVPAAPAKPTGVTVTNAAGGVKLSWTKAANITATQVYRKNADGTWTRVKTVTGATWTDPHVTSGKSYTYKLRSCRAEATGKNVYSACTTPVTTTYVAAPTVSKAAVSGGVKLSWAKVSGAAGYQVYRKTGSGSYVKLTTTTSLTCTDTTCAAGKTYSYKVRAYKKVDGTNCFSAFSNVVSK